MDENQSGLPRDKARLYNGLQVPSQSKGAPCHSLMEVDALVRLYPWEHTSVVLCWGILHVAKHKVPSASAGMAIWGCYLLLGSASRARWTYNNLKVDCGPLSPSCSQLGGK